MRKIKLNERVTIVLILILCVVTSAFGFMIYSRIQSSDFANQMEKLYNKNQDAVFSVDKIVTYSSANAIDNSEGKTLQDLNVCQYTDIAIYLDNMTNIKELVKESAAMGVSMVETNDEASNKIKEHTIKELYIDNIKIDAASSKGKKTLSYKNPYKTAEFGDINYDEQQSRIDFDVVSTNVDNEKSDYSRPIFYADCSNPITLSYMNRNIVMGYAVSEGNTQVSFDGKLLQTVGVNLDDIACIVNFDIHLKNNLDQSFSCSVSINVPLKNENKSIYSGYIYEMEDNLQSKYKFFKQ